MDAAEKAARHAEADPKIIQLVLEDSLMKKGK
ncbi:MAG: hypothetical protein CM15mP44_1830 [Candidatus Neomarinimicrobiota bacterium]|nr:MAG: hypothetical protein CM15mP44_1830 [Candidatus Neomarinimicrobiota bacterium]